MEPFFEPFPAHLNADYRLWLSELRPRTCLLLHWLSGLGAVAEPGEAVRHLARRFADKRRLLGCLVHNKNDEVSEQTQWLLDNNEFDLYVAWLMWLRFQEYVPARFVLPAGRENVLLWVRDQLRRPELTDHETLVELQWQASRLQSQWNDSAE